MSFDSDIVIGLEVHAELRTRSKLFCSCPRTGSTEPNTRTCPVCLGHPGSKPVLNRQAVEHAIMLALATECQIAPRLVFSRKSYFYPDMSKNYQITQYELPLASDGLIRLSDGRPVGLTRIHIEEDPAALLHPLGMEKSGFVLVDYNRSGNPLVEVVTKPELKSPAEARDLMKQLISILSYLGIYDTASCIIKADANVSVRDTGYTRVEIKNISGFREIERALAYEVQRQRKGNVVQETRAWDAEKGVTRRMRGKETEEDYGYIFEPDLVVTEITPEWIASARGRLPELALDKRERFGKQYGIPAEDAIVLSAQIELAELYEKVAKEIDPGLAAKWLRRELARVMNYKGLEFADLKIDETHLIQLLSLVEKGTITDTVGQKLMEMLIEKPFDVQEYVAEQGLSAVSDRDALTEFCRKAIEESPKAVAEYKKGEEKALNYLMGQVMRMSRGAAEPKTVRQLLVQLLQ